MYKDIGGLQYSHGISSGLNNASETLIAKPKFKIIVRTKTTTDSVINTGYLVQAYLRNGYD